MQSSPELQLSVRKSNKMTTESDWFIYLIKTAHGSLYTGITTDVEKRLKTHESGKGSKYLRGKGPLTLVAAQPLSGRSLASRAEYLLKQQPAEYKVQLLKDQKLLQAFLSKHLSD